MQRPQSAISAVTAGVSSCQHRSTSPRSTTQRQARCQARPTTNHVPPMRAHINKAHASVNITTRSTTHGCTHVWPTAPHPTPSKQQVDRLHITRLQASARRVQTGSQVSKTNERSIQAPSLPRSSHQPRHHRVCDKHQAYGQAGQQPSGIV